MKKFLVASILAAATSLTACSSIVSKSDYPVAITSIPSEAQFTIRDVSGKAIESGTTPKTITLKSSAGYFKKQSYTVEFQKEGYPSRTVEIVSSVDGWYFGNILFGGLIGMLIVDPATGAMYNLPAGIEGNLTDEPTESADQDDSWEDDISASINERSLTVRSIDSLSSDQIARLERIVR